MVEWWDAMSTVEQVFATIGIAATILLIIQVILLAVGVGGQGDVDTGTDVDTSGLDTHTGDMHGDFGSHGDVHVDMSDGTTSIDADMHGNFGDTGGIEIQDGNIDVHAGDWYGAEAPADATSADTAAAAGSSGIHLFTLQGLIVFFAVFGWSGLIMLQANMNTAGSVALAIALGFVAMFLIALLFRSMLKLQQDGTMDIRNALGKSGTVYMNIPAKRDNKGKVSIMIQGQLVEVDAVTDSEEPIKTGAEVTVLGISNNNSLIVRKK